MTYTFPDFVGNIGIIFILYAYWALQTERLSSKTTLYNVLNFGGAALILFSLIFNFNLSAFMIELAWALISLYGLWKSYQGRPND